MSAYPGIECLKRMVPRSASGFPPPICKCNLSLMSRSSDSASHTIMHDDDDDDMMMTMMMIMMMKMMIFMLMVILTHNMC